MRVTKAFANALKTTQKLPKGILSRHAFLFQWHITDNCNLNCKHCYQDASTKRTLSLEELMYILHQYYNLLALFRKRSNMARRGHINITGGEPFLNLNLFGILETLSRDREISYGILTNGTLISIEIAQKLAKLRPAYVQVSIEGTRETHDEIRGEDSYQKAVDGIKNLIAAGVPAYISFTAHRDNYKNFPDVVGLGRKLGVSRIWADRLIPCGVGVSLTNDLLTKNETLAFFEVMESSRKKKLPFLPVKKDVAMHRALQFLVGGGEPYHCTAGDTLITVLPNGAVLPCRRMPVVVGNVFDKQLAEIYFDNPFLKSLRDKNNICKGCEQCLYKTFCRGGLKCLSYAVNSSPFTADPGCWLSNNKEMGIVSVNN